MTIITILRGLKHYLERRKVFAGVCKHISELTGIAVLPMRLTVIAAALFVTFWPLVIAYIIAGIGLRIFYSHKKTQN